MKLDLLVQFTEPGELLTPESLVGGGTEAGKEPELAGVCANEAPAGCCCLDSGSIMRIALDFVGRIKMACG